MAESLTAGDLEQWGLAAFLVGRDDESDAARERAHYACLSEPDPQGAARVGHTLRHAICDEVPDLWSALLLAGGIPATPPGLPAQMTGLQCRRSTFERTVWTFAAAEPGVSRVTGHADGLSVRSGRVDGVLLDGARVEADLVIVSTGRSGRIGDDLRAAAEGGPEP